ncbi:hypothetical protein NDA18_000626 [Ustilago nuda]|nr:hypothetical protein NDA18_000626 [Ustilago nuda]
MSAFHQATSARCSSSSNPTPKLKRRKSLTQSIRARLSPTDFRDSAEPPVPSVPASYCSLDRPLPISHPAAKDAISAEDLNAAWSTITPPPFPDPLQYASCYCEENIYLLVQQLGAQFAKVNRAAVNIALTQSKRDRKSRGPSPTPTPTPTLFVPVWDLEPTFISNSNKSVLLYQQKASKLPNAGWPVIWDYHVVALATCHLIPITHLCLDSSGQLSTPACFKMSRFEWGRSWVYDPDSRLSQPTQTQQLTVVPWEMYKEQTFRPDAIQMRRIPEHFQPMFRTVAASEYSSCFASDRSHMRNNDGGWNATPPPWACIVGERARKEGIKNNLMQRWVDMEMAVGDADRFGRVWEAANLLSLVAVPVAEEGLGGTITGGGEKKVGLVVPQAKPSIVNTVRSGEEENGKAEREEPKGESQRGGRIASPLFPAYLHASQSHRSQPPPPPASPSHRS